MITKLNPNYMLIIISTTEKTTIITQNLNLPESATSTLFGLFSILRKYNKYYIKLYGRIFYKLISD